jgi:hypothetical protein
MIRTAWEQATDSTSTIKAAFESPGIWRVDPTKLEREGKLSTSVPTALQITIPQLPPMSKKYTNFRAAWQTRINDIYSRMSKTSEHTVLPGLTSTFATSSASSSFLPGTATSSTSPSLSSSLTLKPRRHLGTSHSATSCPCCAASTP